MKRFFIASGAAIGLAIVLATANAQELQGTQGTNAHGGQPATGTSQRPSPRVVYPEKPGTTDSASQNKGTTTPGARDGNSRATEDGASNRRRSATQSESGPSKPRRSERSRAADEAREPSDNRRNAAPRERRDSARQRSERRDQDRRRRAGQQRPETTGQSSDSEAAQFEGREQSPRRSEQPQRNRDARPAQDSRRGAVSVSLSQEQRTRISTRLSNRIDRLNVQAISRSRISVSIGAVVPRSIRLHALPPGVVSIYPRFRGYSFVLVDDEYVIIEPSTRRIVTVIPRSGPRQASRETTGVAVEDRRLRLTPEARRVIHTTILREPTCHLEQRVDFFLFVPLPRTIEVCEFPRQIVEEVPEVESYRYVVRGNEVVIVDPDEHRVLEVID